MNKLLLWRGKRGMTVRDLAEKAGVNVTTIVHLEKNRRKAYVSTIGKLANALNIDFEELADLVLTDDVGEETNPKLTAALVSRS